MAVDKNGHARKRSTIVKRQDTVSHSYPTTISTITTNTNNNTIQWTTLPQEWRPCEALSLSWIGGLSPYTVTATWWPDGVEQSEDTGRQWRIVQSTTGNSYDWNVNVPANSTVQINCFDSSATPRVSETLNLHVNYTSMRGYNSSWCLDDDPSAINAIPGVQNWNAASPTQGMAEEAASPAEITKFVYVQDTYEVDILNNKITGFSVALAFFVISTVIMGLLYWRTRQRLKRMERVRNWMNAKMGNSNDNDRASPGGTGSGEAMTGMSEKKPWESFTASFQKLNGHTLGFSNKKAHLAPPSSALFLPLSGSSTNLATSSSTSTFMSTSASRNIARDGLSRLNTRYSEASSRNPFDDDSSSEVISPDSSTSQRMSRAETTTSEAPTIESTIGSISSPSTTTASRFSTSSSAAPSVQASTVGGSSTVSDEFWSRTKASTISPITPGSGNSGGSRALLMPFGKG